MKKALLLSIAAFLFSNCISLAPTSISRNGSLEGFRYFYVTPTAERNSVSGGTYGNQNGVYGSTSSNSVSPSELIAGYMMNKGYVRVPEVKAENAKQTMIINYGDGNSREGMDEFAIEVTIQILGAEKNDLICICRADAKANTEAKAIRRATEKCLNEIFIGR
ncbi:MAG: hypothetical protein AUK63_1631 [bacterium P3]|nr:MAG: hypothetical protein AUK63_1631 [bacterium P3]KWW39009.1 MAG: hypothetical protein F083_1969 [bacterium F083]